MFHVEHLGAVFVRNNFQITLKGSFLARLLPTIESGIPKKIATEAHASAIQKTSLKAE